MIIQESALKHWIDNFYGYGSWDARIWFIGYEEGGGELPEEVADKINFFQNEHDRTNGALCEIRELYKNVAVKWDGPKTQSFSNLYEYRFDRHAVLHGYWKNLIAFAHGYRSEKLPDLLEYQQHSFLSPSSQKEALIQLYPLPSPHNHAWYYSWLDLPQLGFIRNRTVYQEHVYESRIHTILSNIRKHKPELVLMYGMDNINTLKKSVQEFFPGAKFKIIKATIPNAIGSKIPQHHRADLDGTTMLITTQIPALRHNRIESGFDWHELGKRLKTKNS